MTIKQIKETLISQHNVDPEMLEGFKKEQLENMLDNMTPKELEDFEFNLKGDDVVITKEADIPNVNRCDPEWSDYAKSHLSDDEKFGEYPKTDGLKRLVEQLIGPIVSIKTTLLQVPSDHSRTATATSEISILDAEIGQLTTFTGSADADEKYIAPPFNQFLSALAETRAEGRAYRKALRLKNTVSFEEMPHDSPKPNWQAPAQPNNTLIKQSQINFIDKLCNTERGMNINVEKAFVKFCGAKKNINQYSHEEGIKMSSLLSEYQSDTSKIEEDIIGYDPSWKTSNFGV